MAELSTRIQGPVAVIGDVHGQADKLLTILDKLRTLPDYEQRWIVFIGDFVDRGPDPKAALDIFCDLITSHPRTTAIAGNHEYAMAASLGLLPTPEYSTYDKDWLNHYLSETTFESYGAQFGDLDELRSKMPEHHKQLISILPWCVEHPKYLFVHAGLDPNMPFEMQLRILRAKDLSLNRPQWLCSKSYVTSNVPMDCPVTVVAGHVKVPEVDFQNKKILIDTTGGTEGDLSCVLLPENQVITSGLNPSRGPVGVRPEKKSWWKKLL
ncbi:metallophosphoesterase [bacterium]|nr:metallophosphoesterase [bacterium]